ncbi:MAG: hypothetical protein ACLRVB_04570 [Blautia sp.]
MEISLDKLKKNYNIYQKNAFEKPSYAENRAKTGLKIKSLFAVDTGMNRIGIDASDPE